MMCVALAGMVLIIMTTPGGTAPARLAPPPVTERVAAVEGVFCGLLAQAPDLEPRFGTALSQSGELQHQTLGALAGRWGQDGDPGARAQVMLECRRLGLVP
jgi:hypothetical protein